MDPTSPAVAATEEAFELGEGPVWNAVRGTLLWVDILSGLVLEGELRDRRIVVARRMELGEMVGAVVPGPVDSLLLAGQERLHVLGVDDVRLEGPRLIPEGSGRRLNDGATDPAGRFLVGTLSLGEPTGNEVLLRLEADGRLTTLDDDLGLSNGLAWSADGTLMYSVDTAAHTVYVRAYDPNGEAVGPRRVHLDLAPSHPDGITIDAADHLWVALWGSGEVHRYSPDGDLVARLPVPVPNVSSVAFAGRDLRTLVITTARDGLSPDQRDAYPDSGRLFTAEVEVPGLPTVPWAGAAAAA